MTTLRKVEILAVLVYIETGLVKYIPSFIVSTFVGPLLTLVGMALLAGCGMAYNGCNPIILVFVLEIIVAFIYVALGVGLFKLISKGTSVSGLIFVFTYPFLVFLLPGVIFQILTNLTKNF